MIGVFFCMEQCSCNNHKLYRIINREAHISLTQLRKLMNNSTHMHMQTCDTRKTRGCLSGKHPPVTYSVLRTRTSWQHVCGVKEKSSLSRDRFRCCVRRLEAQHQGPTLLAERKSKIPGVLVDSQSAQMLHRCCTNSLSHPAKLSLRFSPT